MVRAYFSMVVMGFFALSGCATAQAPAASRAAVTPGSQECQARINSLEMELSRLKDENYNMRKQLEAASKREVRMPNAIEIQTALKKAGLFKGAVDGQIGPETKDAIRKFQQSNKMTPDGVVGSKTWALLSKYLDAQSR
jgi:murein L,D-transpeptidase YcbB/YkuD